MADAADATPASQRVRTERHGHVLVITLRREAKRNAIDRAMADALELAFNELDDDPDLYVGVLSGGNRDFCAGSDLNAKGDYVTPRGGEYGLIRRRRRKPLVAAVEGRALGGGFEVVLACDMVVAADNALFGLPEVAIGVVPTCGALFRAPRALPANVARELVLTGDPIDAARAHVLGFVNVLTPAGGTLAAALSLAQRIAAHAPLSVQHSLRAVNDVLAADDLHGWAATEAAFETIKHSEDLQEGFKAFFGKRAPVWRSR
ncbi:enoyl-CoA hydratase [Ramlibacter sp. WS9]|nr:enoyl-CoA hydratase [Ramlibacter sp. WS9]